MVTVGVLVRTSRGETDAVARRLRALDCVVETLELEEPGTLGAVLRGESLNAAHDALTQQVQPTEGVLAAWPLHAELA